MGPEPAVNAVYANRIAAIEDPDDAGAFVEAERAEYEEDVDLLRLASDLVIDAIVQPEDLRGELIAAVRAPRPHRRVLQRAPPRRPAGVRRGRPVDFERSDEHERFAKVVRDFAEQEIAPRAEAWDRDTSSRRTWCWPWASSACSVCRSRSSTAASGADFTTLCVAIEEIARVDSSMAITLEAGFGLGAAPIARFGTDEQRARWLPDLCAGRALAAFGTDRARRGSDAGGDPHRAPRSTATSG